MYAKTKINIFKQEIKENKEKQKIMNGRFLME